MRSQHKNGQRFPHNVGSAALFLVPSLVIIAAVLFYPLLRGIGMGFTDRIFGLRGYSFVGLENYRQMLADPLFWHSLGNSLKLTALNVVCMIVLGLGLALLLNSRAWFKSLFKPLLFVPWAMPSMVIVLMFRWLYNDMYGWPNYALTRAGVIEEPVNLLAGMGSAWVAVLIPLVWSFYPFVMIVFLSALQSIDANLYEAAAIDGANAWQSFRVVTWPALRPVILILVALGVDLELRDVRSGLPAHQGWPRRQHGDLEPVRLQAGLRLALPRVRIGARHRDVPRADLLHRAVSLGAQEGAALWRSDVGSPPCCARSRFSWSPRCCSFPSC